MTVTTAGEVHFSTMDKKVIGWASGIIGTLIAAFTIAVITLLISLSSSMEVTNHRMLEWERWRAEQTQSHMALQSQVAKEARTITRLESTLETLNETLKELRADLRARQ